MINWKELSNEIRQTLPGIRLLEEEPLARHTSFRIGGPAAVFAQPSSAEELAALLRLLSEKNIRPRVLGAGTNVLAPDEGLREVVVCTKDALLGLTGLGGGEIEAGAGETLSKTAVFARNLGLTGLEFAHGIPGTVGGGIYMNAGAYGGEMKQVVTSVTVFRIDGTEQTLSAEACAFGYRTSVYQTLPCVIVRASLQLQPGDPNTIAQTMRALMEKRKASQPLELPSAGSTFKRPVGYFAGPLIEQAGLKGQGIGGAAVSEKHAGFVVNCGGATTDDIRRTMELVQTRVLETSGVQLEPVDTETGQKLLFGAGILAQCTVIQPQTLTLCEDAYSTRGDFQPQWQEQEYSMRLDVQTLREPIRPSFPAQASAVLDCRVYPDAMALERTADGVIVHVPLRADTVYTDADGAVQSESFRTEVSCKTALDEDCACEAVFQLQPEGYAAAGSGAVELRYDAVFQLQSFAKQKLQNLVGGTLDLTRQPRAERASVVIRRTGAQQPLWDLAKRYRSTAQAIQTANHLTQPEVEAGRLLLIPM